jgi:hypothetical protein
VDLMAFKCRTLKVKKDEEVNGHYEKCGRRSLLEYYLSTVSVT